MKYLVLCMAMVACGGGGGSNQTPDGGPLPDAGPDGGNGDGGSDGPLTLSPESCQAELTIVREEPTVILNPPLLYKGDFYGFRSEDDVLVLKELASDITLAAAGQNVVGFDDPLVFGLSGREVVSAADHGLQNDIASPVAFIIQSGMLRSDGAGGLSKVLARDEEISLAFLETTVTGTVDSFSRMAMGAEGRLYFHLRLEGQSGEYLAMSTPDGAFVLVLQVGTPVDETFSVLSIDEVTPTNWGMLIRTTLTDGDGTTGTVYFHHGIFGELGCVGATIDTECEGGLEIPEGFTVAVDDYYSDGYTTAAILRNTPNPELHYRVRSGSLGILVRGVEDQGFEFNNFAHPRTCERDNSLYFAGQLFDGSRTWYEVMRIDRFGELSQITDFGSLLDNPELTGDVPDEILNMAVGYGCDVAIRTQGEPREGETAPYEGYWISYFNGDTMEVLDETPGRANNGNRDITGVTRSRTGIDPNAFPVPIANIGPKGEFLLLLQTPDGSGQAPASYATAAEPINRCREPSIVNSDADGDDIAPGDGQCDTGGTVAGDAECTLRAAIQETNAAPGSDRIEFEGTRSIAVTSPLPAVVSPVTIAGNAALNGAALSGDEVGLDFQVAGSSVQGLQIEGFPSHGIRASKFLKVSEAIIRANCGWGLWLLGGADLSGSAGVQMRVDGNGQGDGCTGGGIFLGAEEAGAQISNLRSNTNNGPGIISRAKVTVSEVELADNEGDGIVIDSELPPTSGLRLATGELTVRGNRGHGINLISASLFGEVAAVVSDENCGWGALVDSGLIYLEARYGLGGDRHSFSDNGRTQGGGAGGFFWSLDSSFEPVATTGSCGAGGIGQVDLEPDEGPNRIAQADIDDNQGPGIASTSSWVLGNVTITDNFGAGVLVDHDDTNVIGSLTSVFFVPYFGPSTVSSNSDNGIHLSIGDFKAEGILDVEFNSGAGILVEEHHVILNPGTVPIEHRTAIRNNGLDTEECARWSIVNDEFVFELAPCPNSAGIRAEDGNITANFPLIRGNGGAGVSASDPNNDDNGIVTVFFGEVCDNGAANVGETIDFDSVTTNCP